MRMRLVLFVAFVFAAVAAHAAPVTATDIELSIDGKIEIGPDGHVRDVQIRNKVAPDVATLVQHKVREWVFEPIVENGQPVLATTRLRLTLSAVAQGEDDYQLRIKNVWFGEANVNGVMTPPRYPRDAVEARVGAKVILALRVDEHGDVVEVHPYQTSLDRSANESLAKKFRGVFERASIAAVKQWKFDPGEELDGRLIGQTVLVPIAFALSDSPRKVPDASWRRYIPGPITPAPWQLDAPDDASALAMETGETRSLSSRFKLRTDVEGSIL